MKRARAACLTSRTSHRTCQARAFPKVQCGGTDSQNSRGLSHSQTAHSLTWKVRLEFFLSR